jgi:hypothetical protein
MPNWNSIQGKWYPAKEYVVDPKAPKGKEIYEGPCRAATQELKDAGVEHLGEDYHMNIDLMTRARTLGFKDIDEYLATFHQYKPEKAKKDLEVLAEKTVIDHKSIEKKKAHKEIGGGYITNDPKATIYGDFGTAPGLEGKIKE